MSAILETMNLEILFLFNSEFILFVYIHNSVGLELN